MKKLLNTLYVLTETVYLTLEGENVVLLDGAAETARFPLHTLQSICTFSYKGASPALMGKCARDGVDLCFFKPNGRFLARVSGMEQGNVLLRRTQYRLADDPCQSAALARGFLAGKLFNSRWVLERAKRDHPLRVDVERLDRASRTIQAAIAQLGETETLDSLRGVEGEAASRYFDVFDELLLQNKDVFSFGGRSRRPPLDPVNAALSFAYSLLAGDCAAALAGVGLDPYVGYLHRDRPGRVSLALDLMEELRAPFADRFVVTCINQRTLRPAHFAQQENGAVLLTDEGRKAFLTQWQARKREQITHPFLEEKLPWGLTPHVQALLLARFLRGDLDGYPPFLWK